MNANARVINCQNETNHQNSSSVLPRTGTAQKRLTPAESVTGGIQIQSEHYLRSLAREKAQQGDYVTAIELLTQLIERNPSSASDYNNRGLIYFQSGQLDKAVADYNTAVRLNPQLDSVYNNRANYYAAQGQLVEALADYETTLDLNPGNVKAWINQGITFRQLGLYELALGNFNLVLGLEQLEGNIYAERGRTFHQLGDWNCAVADYNRALALLEKTGSAGRLRQQVETWLNQLLNPKEYLVGTLE